jgi:hypothetical protein
MFNNIHNLGDYHELNENEDVSVHKEIYLDDNEHNEGFLSTGLEEKEISLRELHDHQQHEEEIITETKIIHTEGEANLTRSTAIQKAQQIINFSSNIIRVRNKLLGIVFLLLLLKDLLIGDLDNSEKNFSLFIVKCYSIILNKFPHSLKQELPLSILLIIIYFIPSYPEYILTIVLIYFVALPQVCRKDLTFSILNIA